MPAPDDRRRRRRRLAAAVVAGLAVFFVGAVVARRGGVGPVERRFFRALNGLPAAVAGPVWVVMQLGSLGGVIAVATAAALAGRPRLARRLLLAGSATWGGAKAVKPFVRRDRPAATLDLARVLGRAQRGLGYPSGHAAVAATLAAVAAPRMARPWRPAVWALGLAVGPARTYVGAHLPLDVAGGVGLGVAAGAAARLIDDAS